MLQSRSVSTIALAAALLLAAGCGGGDQASTGEDGIRTGPGISADAITLGVLTDRSGPFKNLSMNLKAGEELWVKDVNAAGGICRRQIQLEVRDHGYKAEQAKILFPDMEPKVAGMLELLGSAVIGALKPDIADNELTTSALAFSSQLLDQPYVLVAGATYDLELINGLAYLLEEGLISKGDKIADIYIDGEGGLNGLAGATFMAEQHDLQLVERKITSTDADMTGVITGLRAEKVKAILLTTSPTQTASVASASKALKLDVPIIANNPSFDPVLLSGPAADALDKLYVAASAVPYSSNVAKAKEVAAAYEASHAEPPSYAVQYGYALGLMWQSILQKACDAEDLSREGIFQAKNASSTIDTHKLTPTLDFSKAGSPSTREVYVAVVDKSAKGGLKQVKAAWVAPDAQTYKAPFEK